VVKVGTVSGTSIIFGPEIIFETVQASGISCCYDETNGVAVIAYSQGNNTPYYGKAVACKILGMSVVFGSSIIFEPSGQAGSTSCISIDGSVVIAYTGPASSYYGKLAVGAVSGLSVVFGTPVVFESANSPYTSCCYDTVNKKAVIAYVDLGNSSHGTSIVAQIPYSSNARRVGISTSSATDGESIDVTTLGGVNENVSGLTPGASYYVASNGEITQAANNAKLGVALASNKLLITEVM
jgi:hypothetical protein